LTSPRPTGPLVEVPLRVTDQPPTIEKEFVTAVVLEIIVRAEQYFDSAR